MSKVDQKLIKRKKKMSYAEHAESIIAGRKQDRSKQRRDKQSYKVSQCETSEDY